MVTWPVFAGSLKTADLVLACFGWFRSQRVKKEQERGEKAHCWILGKLACG